MQRLIDQLVALPIFLPRTPYMAKPFFKLLKKQEGTNWNGEYEAHFQKLE